jgi:hypothetical protein
VDEALKTPSISYGGTGRGALFQRWQPIIWTVEPLHAPKGTRDQGLVCARGVKSSPALSDLISGLYVYRYRVDWMSHMMSELGLQVELSRVHPGSPVYI